jgi:hypothetical protein
MVDDPVGSTTGVFNVGMSDLLEALAAPRIFPGFGRQMVPICAGFVGGNWRDDWLSH